MFNIFSFKQKEQPKEYKHKYECDFYISSNEDMTIEDIEGYERHYEVDNMFNEIIGEDHSDGFLQQLYSHIEWYSLPDDISDEEISKFNKERIKRITEDSKWEFLGLKNIRKYVLTKKLKAEQPYIIKTNVDGNFLQIDKEYIYREILFGSEMVSEEEWNNDSYYTKEIKQAIDNLINKFVKEYNIVANEIFKKLKKIN
ncbi:hypothetical protein ACVWU4_000888 [Campylobacter coli]